MKLSKIRVDDKLYVFDEESRGQVVTKAEKALRSGSTVTWEDGSTQWIEAYEQVDMRKSGSDVYTWNKAGTKVKADVVLVTKTKPGGTTKKKVGTTYVTP
jgi:hypothetical protein